MTPSAATARALGLTLWLLASPVAASAPALDRPPGIAVVPFTQVPAAGTEQAPVPDVATMLAGELGLSSNARVVAPSELRGDRVESGRPEASDFRRWAHRNAVERVVAGRTSRRSAGELDVEVELRSGHSGAAVADYRLEAISQRELPGAVEKLATLILADLGDAPVADEADGGLPPVATAGRPSTDPDSSTDVGGASDGDEGVSILPGVNRDDPISIKSDELEVLSQGGGRRLIFSRNVVVVQGDIRLRADRLEAIYPPGGSQPDQLTATGHVKVLQGERTARCQTATYVRKDQKIHCRGKAELMQGCDRVRGREIEFDLARDRVRVNGGASVVIQPDGFDGKCPRATP